VNFTRASRKPTHNNGCGPIKKKGVGTHGVENSGYVNPQGILSNLAENWYGQIAYRISPYLTIILLIPSPRLAVGKCKCVGRFHPFRGHVGP
jgi:hypothetical protein